MSLRIAARTSVMPGIAVLVLGMGCTSAPSTATSAGTTEPRARSDVFTCPVDGSGTATNADGPARDQQLQVVTTVAPLTSIVANIAGDRARVTGIIPEGEDSHTFEPKPSAAKALTDADVVFVNGLQLEDPTKELARSNTPANSQIVELGTRTITPEQYVFDASFPAEDGKPNPHLWTNPPMAACYARIAASTLSQADPANASYYEDNAAMYTAKLARLDELMKAGTASLPEGNRKLLTYHDAYAYFAEHYGWRVIGAVQVSSFEDPTPKEVAALIEQVDAEKVPAIFGSEVFPSPVLRQIADETGVRYVDDLRDDDLPGVPGDPAHSLLGLLKFDFVTMVSSLGGDATGLAAFDPTDVATDHATYPQ